MNTHTKTGLEILQVAVILGVLGDLLLRQTPWGLNVLLFNLAFVAAMMMLLQRRAPEQLNRHTLALFGAILFFASMFVWRDSIELRVADTFAIIAILAVLFLPRLKVVTQVAGVFHYVIAFFWSGINALLAPFALVAGDVKWSNMPADGWRKHLGPVLRGVTIAAPLILVFGLLFMAADAAYEGMVRRAFNIMPETVFSHVLIFTVFAWLSAGYLRGLLIQPIGSAGTAGVEPEVSQEAGLLDGERLTDGESKVDSFRTESGEHPVTLPDNLSVVEHINVSDPPNANDQGTETVAAGGVFKGNNQAGKPKWQWASIDNSIFPTGFTLGAIEVGIILGLMNLLFLSFVIVQVPYLFGGMELVQNTPDFKLAEYARRGFGELVAVSALVLPTLLIGHWLIKKESRSAENLFRVLAGVQIVLLFVIMASAVQRLVLLTGNVGYGMTTVRLYPLIFMSWLAIVFVWFAATVLRGSRQYFAIGALWSAIFVLGATHFLNPDEFIVKTNLALMREGREFDADYSFHLSNDALPALVAALPELNEEDACIATRTLRDRSIRSDEEGDLRSWSVSRVRARQLLEQADASFADPTDCAAGRAAPIIHDGAQ